MPVTPTVTPTRQAVFIMIPLDSSRRSFLKTSVALAGSAHLMDGFVHAQPEGFSGPLVAYVGTFSSPLRDVLPTQVDLPPGNGRGIHIFLVNRDTGAMTPASSPAGKSPSISEDKAWRCASIGWSGLLCMIFVSLQGLYPRRTDRLGSMPATASLTIV